MVEASNLPGEAGPDVTATHDGRQRARPVAAFDPGFRIGFALVGADGRADRRAVLGVGDLATCPIPEDAKVIVGGGTGRAAVMGALRARGMRPVLVDERGTTLLARTLWWRDHPPRGWTRLLPHGLRPVPTGIDDYAAWAIALRHLGLEEAAAAGGISSDPLPPRRPS